MKKFETKPSEELCPEHHRKASPCRKAQGGNLILPLAKDGATPNSKGASCLRPSALRRYWVQCLVLVSGAPQTSFVSTLSCLDDDSKYARQSIQFATSNLGCYA